MRLDTLLAILNNLLPILLHPLPRKQIHTTTWVNNKNPSNSILLKTHNNKGPPSLRRLSIIDVHIIPIAGKMPSGECAILHLVTRTTWDPNQG